MGLVTFKLVKNKAEKALLVELVQVIWPEVYVPIIGVAQVDYMLANYQSLAKIEADILSGAKYFLLYNGKQAIGYTAYIESATEIYLSKLYLSKSVRGQGLAKQVFQWYETLAEGKLIRLIVNKDNQTAISVYEHQGFQRIASQVTEIGQGYVMDDYVYQKKIPLNE